MGVGLSIFSLVDLRFSSSRNVGVIVDVDMVCVCLVSEEEHCVNPKPVVG